MGAVNGLEERIDRLIGISVGSQLRGRASALGARLVNEVLSIRGLPEKEASRRRLNLGVELSKLEHEKIVPGNLLGDFNQALELYPALVEKYRSLQAPAQIGEDLISLGNNVAFLDRVTDRDFGGPRGALLRSWTAGVFRADETLKRVAARTTGERADPTPGSEELGKVSWNTATALAGVLAVGGLVALGSGSR